MPNQNDEQLAKSFEAWEKSRNKQIANEFKDYIKESYLTRICSDVTRSLTFKGILDKGIYGDAFDPANPMRQDFRYDIAINVSMIHWYNCLGLPKDSQKRTEKYNSKEYTDILINDTVAQCELRLLLSKNEWNNKFAHTPIAHSILCLTNYFYNNLIAFVKANEKAINDDLITSFMVTSTFRVLNTCKSIIAILDLGDVENACSMLRGIVELYVIAMALQKSEDGIKEYYKFQDFQVERERDPNGDYSQKFIDIYPGGCSKSNFLNYGWLHVVYPDQDFKYVFADVVNSCPYIDAGAKKYWLGMYQALCPDAHGRISFHEHFDVSYCEICSTLATLLFSIEKFFTTTVGCNCIYNDVNLIDNLKKKFDEVNDKLNHLVTLYNLK